MLILPFFPTITAHLMTAPILSENYTLGIIRILAVLQKITMYYKINILTFDTMFIPATVHTTSYSTGFKRVLWRRLKELESETNF